MHITQWYLLTEFVIALPVAAAIVWGIVRAVQHMMAVNEAIVGREGTDWVEGIPSMVQRFSSQDDALVQLRAGQVAIDTRLIVVEKEFATNGGSSVKDDLNALKAGVAALKRPPRATTK